MRAFNHASQDLKPHHIKSWFGFGLACTGMGLSAYLWDGSHFWASVTDCGWPGPILI